MTGNADSSFVEAPPETRVPRSKRRFHQRIAHRPLCRRAVEGLADRRADAPLPPSIREARAPTWDRWSLLLAYGGLIARTFFYLLLFAWASHYTIGAAALQGAVAADVITWFVLGAFRIPFEGLEVTVDGIFELALIVFYLNRDSFFSIAGNVEFAGVSFFAFLLFAAVRLAIWGTESTMDSVSGT